MKIDAYSLAFNCPPYPSWGTALVTQDTENIHLIKEDIAKDIILGIVHKNIPFSTHDFSVPLGKGSHIYYGDTGFEGSKSEPLLLARFDKVFVNGKRIPAPFYLAIFKDKIKDHPGRLQLKYPSKLRYGDESNLDFFAAAREVLGIDETAPWVFETIDVVNQEELHFGAISASSFEELEAMREEGKVVSVPSPSELKQAFKDYLCAPGRFATDETGPLYWRTIISDREEIQFLKEIISDVTSGRETDLFSIYDEKEVKAIWEKAKPDERNKSFQSSIVSAIVGKYKDFLHDYMITRLIEKVATNNPIQCVYFGAPGTGKSYKIKHDIIPEGVEPYRVTFYPDYYYSDFVGGLRPQKGEDGIDYKFEPGPFAKALKDSFSGPTYLIIEEINRGNAAAIFGDIFQLLDRKGGRSEYSITNKELYEYLVSEGVTELKENKIHLPANLNILCTMNTADQNVFVLDTAFKRRFKMVYVPIDFNAYYDGNDIVKADCKGYLENAELFNAEAESPSLEEIMTTDLFDSVSKIIGEPKRNWPTFAAYVNAKIDSINASEQKISEDKKLGPFFVDPDELTNRKAFADKVIYYLKQDVFKYEDNILKESYEDLYDSFVNQGKDIFDIFQHSR